PPVRRRAPETDQRSVLRQKRTPACRTDLRSVAAPPRRTSGPSPRPSDGPPVRRRAPETDQRSVLRKKCTPFVPACLGESPGKRGSTSHVCRPGFFPKAPTRFVVALQQCHHGSPCDQHSSAH